VLAPDAPGCGESDLPPAPLSIEDHAAHLEGLLRAQGIDRCDVVGVGGGGVVARCLARRAPRLVAALALGASPCADEVEAQPLAPRADGGHNVDAFLALQRLHGPDAQIALVARDHAEALRGGPAAADGAAALRRARDAGDLPRPVQPTLALDGPAHAAPGAEECTRILRFLDGCTI
jgi:pimeloyl-ACP methyl ester carboxylesterase